MTTSSPFAPVVVFASVLMVIAGCQKSDSEPTAEQNNGSPTELIDAVPSVSIEEDLSQSGAPAAEPQSAEALPTDRALPSPPDQAQADPPQPLSGDSPSVTAPEDDLPNWDADEPTAEQIAGKAFQAPPGATQLTKQGRLWVDPKKQRVYVDGYVALKRGALEMFACPVGTKEHESIVAVLAKSREVHAALLAIEATPGTPVRFRPEFHPPTGQVIRVWVCWYDQNKQFHAVDAREWVEDLETEKAMQAEWVFAGSEFWEDPEDHREYYRADVGDMICVSNFSSAMLDVAIPSSADAGSLRFVPLEAAIPEPDTPVRLVLAPVPETTATGDKDKEPVDLVVPTATDVPRAE